MHHKMFYDQTEEELAVTYRLLLWIPYPKICYAQSEVKLTNQEAVIMTAFTFLGDA